MSRQRCVFEEIVMDCSDCIIAVDNAYNITMVNNTMKQYAKRIIGTDIYEGMNLEEVFSGKQHYLNTWKAVFAKGQPSKKTYSNAELSEIACHPLKDSHGKLTGAYGFLRIRETEGDEGDMESEVLEHARDFSTFEMIADNLPHVVWVSTIDGNVFYCNQKWCEYTGLTKELCKGRQWLSLIHPDDAQHCMDKWTEAMNTGVYEIRYRVKRADGAYRWNVGKASAVRNAEGKIAQFIGTCTDIQDLVEVESKLSNITEQLNLLMTAAYFGVWSWDLKTDQVTVDVNTMDLFNINPDTFDYTGASIFAHVHPEDIERVKETVQRGIKEREICDCEMRISGTNRILAGRGKTFWNEQGEPVKMVGMHWDITQKKTLENERMKALEFAEEQARKRTQEAEEHHKRMEEFVDTICHEIRNPLNGITGMINMMRTALEPLLDGKLELSQLGKTVQQFLECISTLEQCAHQQRVIVDDVLDLSKVENNKLELNPTVFNPKELLETVGGVFLGSLQQKNLKLLVHCSEGVDGSFKADSHRLSQVLMNLLSNSIKFTESGSITISITKENLSESGDCLLRFRVKDTGIGMTQEELTRLFNKFAQANPSISLRYGGSGLGLVISKKLVQKMGGSFHVESEKGVGTTFEFAIQCKPVPYQEPMSIDHHITEKVEEFDFSPLKILIAEDNVINQKILTNYLKQKHCSSQVANNGVEALHQCAESKFDIIFMDLEMPIMGGLEATRKIRELVTPNQQTPIIGLSGNARKEHKEEAIRCGMNEYLTKPYHKTDIYKMIMKFCKQGNTESSVVCPKRKRIN